ncbi:Translational activator GCN1 [Spatholobus suberectus]|nr:Translational activator GCN1 [Spatholobus suberectus]
MAESLQSLVSLSELVSTSSTNQRVRIFRSEIPAFMNSSTSEMSTELASLLTDIIFRTVSIYDDLRSRKAVDDVIVRALGGTVFMKTFAGALVQNMEKQLKFQSHVGCYRLLSWSCLLLSKSQFAAVSKNALCRVAAAQASLLSLVLRRSFREGRACRKKFFRLFSQSPDTYKVYMEELRNGRIPFKDSPELLMLLLEFSSRSPSLFGEFKPAFLDIYVNAILNAKEKPGKSLTEAFRPLYLQMSHEDFQNIVIPSSVKMLKRNPEIVLESVGFLLKSVNLDLSKYAVEILSVVLAQARHADEGRRDGALAIVRSLSQKSSNPDALDTMFNAIKAVIKGSEGRLAFPYQRVGMVNAMQELSNAPDGKYLISLSRTICDFLLSYYKDDGNEEVKIVILSAIASWAVRSTDIIQESLVSFLDSGLKEKETLRKGFLRSLHALCKNEDALLKMLPLFGPLVQLVKTGFTKAVQRLDGMYALLLVAKIAAVDIKAEETLVKEKIWAMISQNEPSVVPISMASKLSVEDSMACVDLLEVLLTGTFTALMIFFICHPRLDIRRTAYNVARKIIASASQLSEDLFLEFSQYLTLIGENLLALKISDTDVSLDPQVPFIPSVEVLVKALLIMSPAALKHAPDSFVRIILCSHHPCVVGSAKRDAVWKRLSKCLLTHGFVVIDIISTNVGNVLQVLLGPMGLKSANPLEQQAAILSLSNLMSIIPGDTYIEFEKHLLNLPERFAHDTLSENDIQIFHTPEGILSTEQGVYVAESVTAKNTKQAKGRFRMYDDEDGVDHTRSNHSVKRDQPSREAAGAGKKDTGKAAKKADKGKTAKEEARDLLLKEEASVRDRVHEIQKNLSLMLRTLGEMAIANSVFAHSRLPSMVKFIEPLMRSPIVSDEAFETMVKLAKCTAPPLCDWALDISTALRLIVTDEVHLLLDLVPSVAEEEVNERPFCGLFERILDGLSISCKSGALPVDSFSFVFPIIERILLCSKKTKFHDDVLRIFYLHLDPHLPLPRIRMLSVLYHVLGVVPAYQASIGPALNELSLGLQPVEVASALYGVYAKDVHVRMACLNAVNCIPAVANRSLPENIEVATSIWIALHDPEKSVAQVAEDIWDHYGFDFGTDFSGLFKALSHINYNVRVAAAEALAAALDEHPDSMQESLSTLFSLYICDMGVGDDNVDAGWLGRQGIALALHSAADVLRTKDLPIVMTFLISRALADPNADVRGRMINAGILIIDKNGKDNVSLLFPIFENYLNKTAPDEEKYDLVREGVVIFTGALAKHLAKDDPKVHAVVDKLLDVLNTPSEAVQRAVSACLSPLMQSKQDDAAALVNRLLDQMLKSEKYGERRGAAFGLAGLVKGFGISCLKKYRIVITLQESLAERNSAKSREGALLGFECLCETLGRLFEPYVIQMLPLLLVSFSDQVVAVREAAECAARAMMSQLSAQGVKLVLPSLLKGLEDKAWRTKQSSVQLLGAMAYCAPQQLSQCLPKIVPKLTEVLTDTHPKVQSAGQMALQQVGSVIKNPEISALVPTLLKGLSDPNEHTKYSLDILLQTTFVNSIDAPSLALLVPIVHRGLRERSADTKKRAAQIVGNMCSLVTEPKDMIPYIGLLLPEVKKVLVDPIPEVRSVAARAIGSLIGGMGEENFPDLVPWLFDTLKSDNSNVERSGAAQGLSEVLAALGIEFFEHVLPDIIRNCSHQKASVRDGYLTLFKYLPRSLGVQFQNYLPQVLPAILDGLADENESVRDAALGAGHVLVEHYATTSLPLLLPAVEDGIFNDSWRIRQSSVELLGDLLFKVAGTSGKALLEGGSDDEGSSTEAHGRAIIEVLGRDKRNEVLAALYMVRADVSLSVRQAALHVWKTIVANTPKTLREIMPVLMDTLITSLASSSSERRQVAGRSLGELVRKLGERVLPLIIPILSQGLNDPASSRRQGVCVGLSEVMASAGKSQLLTFMNELIPTIRTALCDSVSEVRESAGLAFSTLYKSAGMLAIDEIVPTLLHALEDDEISDTALDGLKQILSVRTSAVLPHILPKLVHPPLSAFNAHALGALAEVAGPGLDFHLGTVLPPLLSAMGDDDKEVQTLAKEAAETVVSVIDEEGVEPLISELVKGVNDSQAAVRRSSSYLIGYFFKNSKLYLVDEAPNMISTLIILLSDSDSATVTVVWEALSRVIISVPKEVLPSYIKLVRDAVSTSRDKERRKKKGGPILIPGFCLPKALQPILPIFLQGLISGSAELREQAALGLGELIEVTSEQSLKEFVIPITGPLIRIIGDRFPWQVKSAILSTLTMMIKKGGISLKPFLPQLQTTFVKCLQDSTRTVRSSAALALGKLSRLSTRVDPLVSDLLSSLQGSDGGVREAILTALKGVLKHAGKNVSSAVRNRFYSVLKDLIHHDDDRVRMYAASILGILTQYLEDVQLTQLIQELSSLANSPSWPPRHGSILTISSLFRYNPATICSSSLFPTIVDCLRDTLKDEKFPLRETSTKALGRLLLYRAQMDPSDTLLYKDVLSLLVSSTHDDSSEVRRRAISAIKAVAKANPSAIMSQGTIVGPALAECLKDANTPVRLAAERCTLHAFQLTKGSENVQAAQKYFTGLDARRLSKFSEYSDDSDDSDEDTSSG